jgi:aconitate hydratase
MLRGLFMNKSVRNLLAPDMPPGFTIHAGSDEILPIWRAAQQYQGEGASVVIVAGERYGMGSSRDWAAKGAALLGARAVLATSFERIHRSNLINMGVLPLKLPIEYHPEKIALSAGDVIYITAHPQGLAPRSEVPVEIRRQGGGLIRLIAIAAVETTLEVSTLKSGGILPMILEKLSSEYRG